MFKNWVECGRRKVRKTTRLLCWFFDLYKVTLGVLMYKFSFLIPIIFLVSCAKPTVIETVMPGDEELNCGQLKNAYAEAEMLKEDAKEEKGITGGNTARALVFWPAVVGTYMNSNEAIQAADTRKVHLLNIMRSKECSGLDNL